MYGMAGFNVSFGFHDTELSRCLEQQDYTAAEHLITLKAHTLYMNEGNSVCICCRHLPYGRNILKLAFGVTYCFYTLVQVGPLASAGQGRWEPRS